MIKSTESSVVINEIVVKLQKLLGEKIWPLVSKFSNDTSVGERETYIFSRYDLLSIIIDIQSQKTTRKNMKEDQYLINCRYGICRKNLDYKSDHFSLILYDKIITVNS